MEEKISRGKRRTILIAISVLLVSLTTIYLYQVSRPEFDIKKLLQQVIRFILTALLLFMTYRGEKWAKIGSIVLFSIAAAGALVNVIRLVDQPFFILAPSLVMSIIYTLAIYHFGFSANYKAFFAYQNLRKQFPN